MDRRILAGVALLLTAAIGVGFAAMSTPQNSRAVKEGISGSGYLEIVVETGEGTRTIETHNLVTQLGANYVENALRTGTIDNAIKWISLGDSGSVDDSLTQLTSELTTGGLSRTSGTITNVDDNSYEASNTFTSTADGQTVNTTGLSWGASGDGQLWAAATISSVTLDTDDNLIITWTVNHN